MLEIFGSFLAGIGLFFTGVKLVSSNLKQMTSRRFRLLVSRWTGNGWRAGLLGAVAGAVTQSASAIAFLIISLISSGLITVRNALPIMTWANVGLSSLVLLATLNIELMILYLIGVAGVCFAFDKPAKSRTAMAALFGIGLLFLGLQTVRMGTEPLEKLSWFQLLLNRTHSSYAFAFVVGALLTFVAQSSVAVSLIAITMTGAGLFTTDQTIMLIYGTNVGDSCITWFLSSGLKGTPRQLAMFQVLFNVLGGLLFVPLFYLELHLHVPLVKRLVGMIAQGIEQQMASVYLVFNLLVAIVVSPLMNPIHQLLVKAWPPTDEEDHAKVKFIHDQALSDPETAMDLVEKEQVRLVKRLPEYMEELRTKRAAPLPLRCTTTHNSFTALATAVQSFLTDLVDQNLAHETSERLLNIQNRHSFVMSLEENVYQLATTIAQSHCSEALQQLIHNFVEGLDTILLTAIDAMASSENLDIELLISLTADRGGLMERIRQTYLSNEGALELPDKSLLLYITNLFERITWMLERLGILLRRSQSIMAAESP